LIAAAIDFTALSDAVLTPTVAVEPLGPAVGAGLRTTAAHVPKAPTLLVSVVAPSLDELAFREEALVRAVVVDVLAVREER